MARSLPDAAGYFGQFGGRYVPETLMAALDEFEGAYKKLRRDREFRSELDRVLEDFVGRPTPLTEASRFASLCGGDFRLFLKREDLNHTGAHKINNALGQALIAKRMGKQRIIAETGAGQHGVATATACALLGLQCVVYMGEVDMARQELNVFRMQLLGAEVVPVNMEYSRCWRLKSWDRFILPKPFSTVRVIFGPPHRVASTATDEEFKHERQRLQDAMMQLVEMR